LSFEGGWGSSGSDTPLGWRVDPFQASLPAFLDYPGSGFSDPESWYRAYQGMPDELRSSFEANQASAASAYAARERNRAGGVGELRRRMNAFENAYELWQADPFRAAALESLETQASPEYSFVSPQQRAAMDLQIAQSHARNQAVAEASAAARGVSGGGPAGGNEAAMRAYADTAGLLLGGQVDAANAESRARAADALGRLNALYGNVDLAYQGGLNQLSGGIADLKSGDVYEPTDYTAFAELAHAMQSYDESLRLQEEGLDAFREQQEPGLRDFLSFLLDLGGTGLPEMALNAGSDILDRFRFGRWWG
jgi:hypothetical protein